jgi:hypothetical protein
MALPSVTITGSLVTPDGDSPVKGTIRCRLSQPGTAVDGGSAVRVIPYAAGSVTNGAVNLSLVPNEAITPVGTFYQVSFNVALSSGRTLAWTENWQLASSPSTIDIGSVPRIDEEPGAVAEATELRAEIAQSLAVAQGYANDAVTGALAGTGAVPQTWAFTGDGVTTEFTLTGATHAAAAMYVVALSGVVQAPTADYTVDLGTGKIVFTSAPGDGVPIAVRSMGYARAVNVSDSTTVAGRLLSTWATHVVAPSDTAGARNLVANPDQNSIASDVRSSSIAGGGQVGFPQRIGSVVGSNASYATIGGGYDNVNNMLAGTICGGAHHFLDSSGGAARDHGTIVGGSWHTIAAGPYNFIGGGTSNEIIGSATRATIAGGQDNSAQGPGVFIGGGSLNTAVGDSSVIAGGSQNDIDSTGLGSTIGGGTQNKIAGTGATYGTIAGGTQNNITAAAYASVGGGLNNDATANYASIGGGTANVASGQFARIGGGSSNTASSTRACVLSGSSNTASTGDSACVINGQQNTASGDYSTVRGLRGSAAFWGQHVISNGYFAAIGDAQAWETVLRASTTDATSTSLTLNGASQIVIPDNTTWAFDILITARRTDAADRAGYRVTGVIARDVGAATTAVYGVTTTVLYESDATWDATAIADTVNGRLTVRGTGAVGKSIRCVAHVRVASVTQ